MNKRYRVRGTVIIGDALWDGHPEIEVDVEVDVYGDLATRSSSAYHYAEWQAKYLATLGLDLRGCAWMLPPRIEAIEEAAVLVGALVSPALVRIAAGGVA